MNYVRHISVLMLGGLITLAGCNFFQSKGGSLIGLNADTLLMNKCEAHDTMLISFGDESKIIDLQANLLLPEKCPDSVATSLEGPSLTQLIHTTLETDTFLPTEDCSLAQFCVSRLKKSLETVLNGDAVYDLLPDTLTEEDENNIVLSLIPVFNRDGIVSLKYSSRMSIPVIGEEKNEHIYLNYDLTRNKPITVESLFAETDISEITSMLRKELLRLNNVDNEEQLVELGYFNLANLWANNNFRISDDGLVWTYAPLEIGCNALGEIEIGLEYALLAPYFDNDSALKNFIDN